jgi:DNA-binding CsgD family transcriptional regulator
MGDAEPGHLLVAAWRGDTAKTEALAEICAREATARGFGNLASFAKYAVAVLEIGYGRYDSALIAAQEASEDGRLWLAMRTLPEIVEAAVRSGEHELAAVAARRLTDTALPSGTEWALGVVACSRALVARGQEADRLYREGTEHLKRCRATPQLARARLLYGEWLRRERRRRDAREQLRSAHKMFSSMGAGAFAARTLIELSATGEHVRERNVDAMDALTPHEAHIASLAAESESNVQIATQLNISPRTVEYHLSKIYRKLRITSRMELARALGETGVEDGMTVEPG